MDNLQVFDCDPLFNNENFLTLVRVLVYRHNDTFLAKPVSVSGPSLISTLTNSIGIVIVNSSGRANHSSSKLRKSEVVDVTLFKNIQEPPDHFMEK